MLTATLYDIHSYLSDRKLDRAKSKYESEAAIDCDISIVEDSDQPSSANDTVMLVKIRSRSGIQRFSMKMVCAYRC